jgi:hypothetical protein
VFTQLFSLLRLLPRHTKGKETLINYSQSHVVAFAKYLDVSKEKTMDKIVTKEIKEGERKGKTSD